MIPQTKKGFTLIELLVVITIIGILATWAVAVYTSNIQRARDTTRINEVKALQWWVEQFYQNQTVYPDKTSTDWGSGWVLGYMNKLPRDPKQWETCAQASTATNQPFCWYIYNVTDDDNGINQWAYEISTAFENKGNLDSKALNDKMWYALNDANRFELWVPTQAWVDTESIHDATSCASAKTSTYLWIYELWASSICGWTTQITTTTAPNAINISWN